MELEAKRVNHIIRYWVLLEELKRSRDAVWDKAAQRGAVDFGKTTVPLPEITQSRIGKYDRY